MYIHQNKDFPHFTYDKEKISALIVKVKTKQSYLLGKMDALGFDIQEKALFNVLCEDVMKSSEIEGQTLDAGQVRYSAARRMGLDGNKAVKVNQNVDGIVNMVMDAIENSSTKMTHERICGWQAGMFPTGVSGLYKIKTGEYRDDAMGEMQIISGSLGKEKVHYEAPGAALVHGQMDKLFDYINAENDEPILKAGIVHLWFAIIHPFDDGNGRIARALSNMLLAKCERSPNRFYSLSAQIKKVRKSYYKALEITRGASLDITSWLVWFLENLILAIENSDELLGMMFKKAEFWHKHTGTPLNERQAKVLNRILDGFEGNLTTTKWAKMTNSSQDTAGRDIQDLIAKGILTKQGEARATHYSVNF
jgi:Fic family protein